MRLSHMLSLILKELIPHNDTHCDSTEDLLAAIEAINNNRSVKRLWKVVSLDIEALYPSLDIPKCAEIISKELYESGISIKNIRWKEVMLYIRYMWNDEQIRSRNLFEFTPVRRTQFGRPPAFSASGTDLDEDERFKSWIFPDIPDENDEKLLFSTAIGIIHSS